MTKRQAAALVRAVVVSIENKKVSGKPQPKPKPKPKPDTRSYGLGTVSKQKNANYTSNAITLDSSSVTMVEVPRQ